MSTKRSLQELTIKDNFMFGAVMSDPDNCKGTLELCLGFEIERVEVSEEKSLLYNPKCKGVRLDIYAKDENNTHYNVEMQALRHQAIEKRARYYHGQMDMEILLSGVRYRDLPDTYVIFICDFDPFGKGKYRYTRKSICEEVPELSMEDGSHTIFLSTKGTNDNEVPLELVRFLKFVAAPLSNSEEDFEDDFVRKLQLAVRKVKSSREMGAMYMTFEEYLYEEREDAREEGIARGLAEGRAEGRAEGLAEGERNHLIELIRKKLNKGDTPEKIAEDLLEELAVVKQIIEELE